MRNLLRDIRFGFRLLIKNPGFTLVAVLALALGIGANTAIFSVIYSLLLAPLPYPHSEQLAVVWLRIGGDDNSVPAGNYLDWKRENRVFQELGAWTGGSVNLSTSGRPEQVESQRNTPGFLSMMGHRFLLGRDFLPEEGEPGKDQEAILSYRLWNTRFGADRAIVGRQVQMNGEPSTIVGVLSPSSPGPATSDLYVPLAFKPDEINHDFPSLLVMGRLKPEVTIAQANADIGSVQEHIAEIYQKSNKGWGVSVHPLKNEFIGRDEIRSLWLLMGVVAFVLLIACANVANLLLARATTRQKEVAVRASIGASRLALFTQFLAESISLSLIGCVVGTMLAWGLLKLISAMLPPSAMPSEADLLLKVPVLLFTLTASLLAGVLFGCAPAWQAARMNLSEVLKEGGRSSRTARHGLRRTLVVVEFALALSLLTGGGLEIHSLWNVAHIKLGFKSDHLLTFYLPVPTGHLREAPQIVAFYQQLHDRIKALPGVTSMSASEGMPFRGVGFWMAFSIEGKFVADTYQGPFAPIGMVTPEYFQTFGIHFDKGRALTEQDRAGGMPVAVVNETFAKKFCAGADPLSQRVLVQQLIPGVSKFGAPIAWQIVGVYQDVSDGGPHGESIPEIKVPFAQSPWPQAFVAVRTVGDPALLSKGIADVVQSLDSNLPLANLKTMDQILDESKTGDRFMATLFGGFAVTALLLAALGIYGVMSFSVAQRTHEIGLRMALGASTKRVLVLILRQGMILALLGLALGFAGAYFVGRGMQSMIFGIGAIDVTALTTVAALLMASALLACYIPARRATRVDPMHALRQE